MMASSLQRQKQQQQQQQHQYPTGSLSRERRAPYGDPSKVRLGGLLILEGSLQNSKAQNGAMEEGGKLHCRALKRVNEKGKRRRKKVFLPWMERGKRSSFESLPPFSPNGFISFHPFPLSSSCEKEPTKLGGEKGGEKKETLFVKKKQETFSSFLS